MSNKSFADIKALKKPNEVSVEIILNPELTRMLGELERRLVNEERLDKKENRTPVAPGLSKQIEELKDKIEDSKASFAFKDPGRKAFEELVEACPATPDQKKKAKEENTTASWDHEKFVPGLLALASFEPELTLEDAQEIYDQWGRGDVEALFDTALQACLEQASVPFTRRDTAAILASVQSLTSASNEESRTDGS